MNPAFGWCHVAAGTLALRLARNSTSTPTNKRTHNKKDIDSAVYLLTIEIHHESISFLFVLLIITSLSAGVLHVPACKHDRPPLPGSTFMYMRCVPHNYSYWLCLSPHPRPFWRRCGQSTVLEKYRNQYYDKLRKQFIDIVDRNARRFLIDT